MASEDDELIDVYEITPHESTQYDYCVVECRGRSYAGALSVITNTAESILNGMEPGDEAKTITIKLVKMRRSHYDEMVTMVDPD